MPKISVLIPIYNVDKYLEECLESIINQTEKNIEIICVEDGSTDNSSLILEQYQNSDNRIKIIWHDKNQGLCKSRKDAVICACGEYIMFVDSDDYLDKNACEELYNAITNKKVDVLQFGTLLEPEKNVSEEMIEWTEKFVEPTQAMLKKEQLIHVCFAEEGQLNCNLWNKIWKTDVCKAAYKHISDDRYVSSEDRYASFLIFYYANSASGIKKKYYHYRMVIGITG